MRLSSQNSAFIFNLPLDIMPKHLYDQFQLLLDKNFIPYDNAMDYLSSTIKELTFPSLSFEMSSQIVRNGKKINWKESGNVQDKFTHDLDITFRSVDSHLNYFMLVQILNYFYLNNDQSYIPDFNVAVIDKDGDLIYSILFQDIILKSIGELRMTYHVQDFSEKTFTLTFSYNWIDVKWAVHEKNKYLNEEDKSIFDVPGLVVPNDRYIPSKTSNVKPDISLTDKLVPRPKENGKNNPNHQI